MKKYIKFFILIFTLVLTFSISVNTHADMGPKPYIEITIVGDTKNLYMTLLSSVSHKGPWSVYDESYSRYQEDEDNITDPSLADNPQKKANLAFRNYEDKDGFFYLEYCSSIENNKYKWGYYPPEVFKILIYNVETETFITDDKIYQKNEFGSVYTLTLSENMYVKKEAPVDAPVEDEPVQDVNNSFVVEKNNSIGRELLTFTTRLIICLAIELLIALLFGFRKLELLPILITNIVTQVAFNLFLTIYIYFNGFQLLLIIPAYIFSELLIFAFEALTNTYFIKFVDNKRNMEIKSSKRIILYTFLANAASLVLGYVILLFFH